MDRVDDLARIATLIGVAVERADLERLAPLVESLYKDSDRLQALLETDVAPAFVSRLPGVDDRERGVDR
jgi:hypothetical protein